MPNRPANSLPSRRSCWRRALPALALPALLAWSGTASAQGWLADRRFTEGPGIRAGDVELHPGIGAEAGYDSNWFLRSSESGPTIANGAPSLPPKGAGVFRVTPSFYVSTLGTQRMMDGGVTRMEPRVISFRGGASATGRFFLGDSEFNRQHNVSVNSDARLDVNAGRPIGFGVFAGYNRLIQPQVIADPDLSFNRSDVRGGAEIIGMPGGGTLDLRGGYQINAALFEETQGVPYTNLTHEFYFKDRWRFRPRTALFHDTSLRFITYPNAARATNFLNESTPVRTRIGITGLLTQRFGATVAAGYGATFFANPQANTTRQYDSINGQVEATYYLGQGGGVDEPGKATLLLSTVSLGFIRDFQNSLLANFYTSNRGYGRLEYWFGGKMVMRLDGYVEHLAYPQAFFNPGGGAAPSPATPGDFDVLRVGGGLFAEYRITAALGLNATVDYAQRISDQQIPAGATSALGAGAPAGPGQVFDLNYNRIQAFAGVRYFY